jgi:hypothetical protein
VVAVVAGLGVGIYGHLQSVPSRYIDENVSNRHYAPIAVSDSADFFD